MIKYNLILKLMGISMALFIVLNSSSFGLRLTSIYYVLGLLFLPLMLLLENRNIRLWNFPMLCLILAGAASILLNDIPKYYQAEQRFGMFVVFTTLIGPLIGGKKFRLFRHYLFLCLVILLIVFSAASYLALAIGYPIYGRGNFTGFFNHSMMLSPMSGIALLSCLYFYFLTTNRTLKYILLACAPLCFLSAVSAGSRSALMAAAAGVLFFFFKLYQYNMGRYVKIILLIVMAGVFSFPLWEERTEFMMNKMAAAEEAGDWASSRESLWEQRIAEFTYSPWIGVGFASEKPEISSRQADEVEEGEGRVEPGSSWLVILSMTGIMGLISMLFIFVTNYWYILTNRKNRLWLAYMGSLLSFFTLHMFAEGYVYAFGSLLFFCLWLVLGVIEGTRMKPGKRPVAIKQTRQRQNIVLDTPQIVSPHST